MQWAIYQHYRENPRYSHANIRLISFLALCHRNFINSLLLVTDAAVITFPGFGQNTAAFMQQDQLPADQSLWDTNFWVFLKPLKDAPACKVWDGGREKNSKACRFIITQ